MAGDAQGEISSIGVKLTLDASGYKSGLKDAQKATTGFNAEVEKAASGAAQFKAAGGSRYGRGGKNLDVGVTLHVSDTQLTSLRRQVQRGLQGIPVVLQPQLPRSGQYSPQNLMGAMLAMQYGMTQTQGRQAATQFLERNLGPMPRKAAGGPVAAGRPVIVGEHRPEVFVPKTGGQIHPSIQSYRREQQMVQQRELETIMVEQARQRSHEARLDSMMRGGNVRRASTGVYASAARPSMGDIGNVAQAQRMRRDIERLRWWDTTGPGIIQNMGYPVQNWERMIGGYQGFVEPSVRLATAPAPPWLMRQITGLSGMQGQLGQEQQESVVWATVGRQAMRHQGVRQNALAFNVRMQQQNLVRLDRIRRELAKRELDAGYSMSLNRGVTDLQFLMNEPTLARGGGAGTAFDRIRDLAGAIGGAATQLPAYMEALERAPGDAPYMDPVGNYLQTDQAAAQILRLLAPRAQHGVRFSLGDMRSGQRRRVRDTLEGLLEDYPLIGRKLKEPPTHAVAPGLPSLGRVGMAVAPPYATYTSPRYDTLAGSRGYGGLHYFPGQIDFSMVSSGATGSGGLSGYMRQHSRPSEYFDRRGKLVKEEDIRYQPKGVYDIEGIAAHEFGHALHHFTEWSFPILGGDQNRVDIGQRMTKLNDMLRQPQTAGSISRYGLEATSGVRGPGAMGPHEPFADLFASIVRPGGNVSGMDPEAVGTMRGMLKQLKGIRSIDDYYDLFPQERPGYVLKLDTEKWMEKNWRKAVDGARVYNSPDFDPTGIRKDLVPRVEDTLMALLGKFPRVGEVLGPVGLKRMLPRYAAYDTTPGQHRLMLAAEAFAPGTEWFTKAGRIRGKDKNYMAVGTAEGVVTHEFGHALRQFYAGNAEQFPAHIPTLNALEKELAKRAAPYSEYAEYARKLPGMMGGGPFEPFAELFSLLETPGYAEPDRVPAWARDRFDFLLKTNALKRKQLGGFTHGRDWRAQNWRRGFGPEMIPTAHLLRYRMINREAIAGPGKGKWYLDELTDKIDREGFDPNKPVALQYNPEHHVGLLGDGNHRLAAALRLGLTELPTELYVNQKFGAPKGAFRKWRSLPGQSITVPDMDDPWYVPRNLPPSWVCFMREHSPQTYEDFERAVSGRMAGGMAHAKLGVHARRRASYLGTARREIDSFIQQPGFSANPDFRDWYAIARAQAMGDMADFGYEGDWNVGLLSAAALSAGQPWPKNRMLFRQLLAGVPPEKMGGEGDVPGFSPVGVGIAYSRDFLRMGHKVFGNEDVLGALGRLRGPKVNPFGLNLTGLDPNVLTLDRRMGLIASGGKQADVGKGLWRSAMTQGYEEMFQKYGKAMGARNISEFQAILWSNYGRGEDLGSDWSRTPSGIVIPRHPGIAVPVMRQGGGPVRFLSDIARVKPSRLLGSYQPEGYFGPQPTHVSGQMSSAIDQIRGVKEREHALMFTSEGKFKAHAVGEQGAVDPSWITGVPWWEMGGEPHLYRHGQTRREFNPATWETTRRQGTEFNLLGMTTVHNHPGERLFKRGGETWRPSTGDVAHMLNQGEREGWVVTPHHSFIMRPGHGVDPFLVQDEPLRILQQEAMNRFPIAQYHSDDFLNSRRLSLDLGFWHDAMTRMSDELGFAWEHWHHPRQAVGRQLRLPGMAGGGRASGKIDGMYLVGEIGEELFVPERLAHMVPKKVMDQIPKAQGGMRVIGKRRDHDLGGELFMPPEDGIIVPNRLMDQVPRAADGVDTTNIYATTRSGETGRIKSNVRLATDVGNAGGIPVTIEGQPIQVEITNIDALEATAAQASAPPAGAKAAPVPAGGSAAEEGPQAAPGPAEDAVEAMEEGEGERKVRVNRYGVEPIQPIESFPGPYEAYSRERAGEQRMPGGPKVPVNRYGVTPISMVESFPGPYQPMSARPKVAPEPTLEDVLAKVAPSPPVWVGEAEVQGGRGRPTTIGERKAEGPLSLTPRERMAKTAADRAAQSTTTQAVKPRGPYSGSTKLGMAEFGYTKVRAGNEAIDDIAVEDPRLADMRARQLEQLAAAGQMQGARTPMGKISQLFAGTGEDQAKVAAQRRALNQVISIEQKMGKAGELGELKQYQELQERAADARGEEKMALEGTVKLMERANPNLAKWNQANQNYNDVVAKGTPGLKEGAIQLGRILVGVQAYTMAMQAVGIGVKAATPAVQTMVDQLRGWESISNQTTTTLSKLTDQQQGNAEAAYNQFVMQQRIGPEVAATIGPSLVDEATVKSGATAAKNIENAVKASMGIGGSPRGLWGGTGGFADSAIATEIFGGQYGGFEALRGTIKNLGFAKEGEMSPADIFTKVIGDAGTQVLHDVDQAFFNGDWGVGPPGQNSIPTDLAANTETYVAVLQDMNTATMQGSRVYGDAERGMVEWVHSIEEADKFLRKMGDELPAELRDIVEWTNLVPTVGGQVPTTMADVQYAGTMTMAGMGLMSPSAYADEWARQMRGQFGLADEQARGQLERAIPYQIGLQNIQQPFIDPAAGISLYGASPGVQRDARRAFRDVRGRQTALGTITQDADTGRYSMGGTGGAGIAEMENLITQQFGPLQDQIAQYGEELAPSNIFDNAMQGAMAMSMEIANLTTEMQNAAAAASEVSLENQFRLANRAMADAAGMLGQIGGSRLGYLQREQWLTSRASQSLGLASQRLGLMAQKLSLDLQARQIATNLAVAQFQAPGETGEERYARQREAIIRAGIERRQLGIGRQQYGISEEQFGLAQKQFVIAGQVWAENARRAGEDAKWTLRVLQAQRDAQVIQARATKQVAQAQRDMGEYLQRAANVAQRAENRKNAANKAVFDGVVNFGIALDTLAEEINEFAGKINGGGGNGNTQAAGYLGDVLGATQMTVGEAGRETVAILRNPRKAMVNLGGGGRGGPTNITVNISGNSVRSDDDLQKLANMVTRKVERALAQKGEMLGLRQPSY